MKKRYILGLDERPKSLGEIESKNSINHINFDPVERDESGDISMTGDNWIICTATRPIRGTVSWSDANSFPMYWSGINMDSDYGQEYYEYCEKLDAAQVVYVTEAEVKETVQAYYDDRMPGRIDVEQHDIRDIFKSFLRIKQGEV